MIQGALGKIIEQQDLTREEASLLMNQIMRGEATAAQVGSLCTALRMKGESIEELAGFAKVLREHAIPIKPEIHSTLVDTCGTGGDGASTFNISTTSAFVVAGAGVPVVKHGNRGVSSRCGSADVLEALGVKVDINPDIACRTLSRYGITFLYAPYYHPAMRHVMGVRRELGFRTIFNLLGPLANPAGATAQLMGVYHPSLTEKMSHVLNLLGTERAMVVHGEGLDEITTHGMTRVSELASGATKTYTIHSEDFGIKQASLHDLRGGDADLNARILMEVLSGTKGAARDIVLLNAGAAIYLGGKARGIADGVILAEESIDSGRALRALEGLVNETGARRGS